MIPPTNNTAGGIILLVDSNSKFCIQTIIIAQQDVNKKNVNKNSISTPNKFFMFVLL